MKYQITKKPDDLEIEVVGIEGKEKQLLEAFKKCQEGRCSCPTQEYQKLGSLQVEQADGKISLGLKSKEGTKFDQVEIEKCLEHTKEKVSSRK
jgi:hypothetical protein